MAVTIKTFRPGPPPLKAAYEGYGPWRFTSGQPVVYSNESHSPMAPILAAYPGVYTAPDDFDLISSAYARTAGHDLIVQLETAPWPLQVSIGDSATENGTYAWSEWVELRPEEMARATLTGAFYRTRTRNVLDQHEGRCTLAHQLVPSSFAG